MYKLIRVIGYGASSVVYQAQKVPIEDVGKPVRRSYPYSTNTVTVIKDDSSDSEDDELDQEEMYEFNEANPDVNIDNESNIEHNEMDLDTIESLNTSLSSSHSSIYHSKSPSPLGQKHFSDGNDQFPPKDEIIVDPVTDPIEVTEVSCQLVVLKFSAHSSPLQNEIYVDSLLDSEYKVGWENQLYSLSKGGRQFCQFCPFVPAPLQYTDKFLIIGQLHRPLIKSVFGIPYKNALALVRDDLMPLLDNLIAIHDSNIIHRDIRPANILKKGDRFIISDFGFAVRAGEEYVEYQGTRETASQRILDKLSRGIFVGEVLQEDDLESFLKLVKISFWGLRLPALNGNKIKYYEDLFRFWMVDHDILYFISLPNLESKRKFLRIFCRKNISLAQARQLYGSSLP
jgi:serine/threonine protein kinase